VSFGHLLAISGDEGTNVGLDAETAVSDDYKQEGNTFIGTIVKVTIDVSPPKMNAADQKALDDAEDAAELAGDCPYADPVADA